MVLRFEAAFLLLPSIVALIYMEKAGLYYLLTAVLCFGIGTLLQLVRSDKGAFYTKEGSVRDHFRFYHDRRQYPE